jgi:hypothetical protein
VSCERIQDELDALVLRRGAAGEDALPEHVATCAGCAAHLRFLRALAATLAHDAPPAPAPALVERSRVRAARALRAHAATPPRGLARETALALAALALALPLAVAHAWLVAEGAATLLGPWLPAAVLAGLGVVYFGSLALAVGVVYALVPLWVATLRRTRLEAS